MGKSKFVVQSLLDMQFLSYGAECNMGNIFRVSHISQLIHVYVCVCFMSVIIPLER